MKKNEILSFTSKWMELEIILRKVSQAQKTKYHMFSLICRLRCRANKAMLLDLGYMLREEHIQEIWGQVGNSKHESVYVSTAEELVQKH
jgi:hypothetical protein